MEVHLTPDVERQLNDLAAQSGRAPDELLKDALAGYLNELLQTQESLNSRYDELKNDLVKPVPSDEVEAHFRSKSAAARRSQQSG
jgi:hypothetical protein